MSYMFAVGSFLCYTCYSGDKSSVVLVLSGEKQTHVLNSNCVIVKQNERRLCFIVEHEVLK